MEDLNTTHIWRKYELGLSYMGKIDLVAKTDKAHRFYLGDQWYGAQTGGEELPSANFIKPIVRYKVSTVCQKSMTAVYSPIDATDPVEQSAMKILNRYFSKLWEIGKMDSVVRKIIKDAAIAGDSYIYFGEGAEVTKGQIIDNVNIFLGDEKNDNIQDQPYIIIRERRFVKDIRAEAEANGIKDENELKLVVSDTDVQNELGNKTDIDYDTEEGKCISLLYFYKDEDGFIHTVKSTKNLIYQPDRKIAVTNYNADGEEVTTGLKCYPIVNFTWEDRKNSARGASEVEYLIPNQLEVNKTLARRALTVKNVSYPKTVVNTNAVRNFDDINKAGAIIEIDDAMSQGVNNIISYLNATTVGPDAKNLSDELMMNTRELAGAGDAAMGSIDPTQTSGAAIIAARDQSALPLNEQMTRYRQFIEDIALVWFDLWRAYNPNGLTETTDEGDVYISADVMEGLKFNVKVDVTDKDSYSRYAEEQTLANLFGMQAITFEEYVSMLSEDSIVPKAKLEKVLADRAAAQQKAAQQQMMMQQAQMMQQPMVQSAAPLMPEGGIGYEM